MPGSQPTERPAPSQNCARTVAIYECEPVNADARDPGVRLGDFISTTMVTAMLRQIMAYNRADGWRKQKKT